jgi:serine/threonine protein kinase
MTSRRMIEFIRKRDYLFVKELGQGACGQTILLHDDVLDEHFVCKKYSPLYDEHKQSLFNNFVREIKLLHEVYHQNVVRVFNYYLYPEKFTGYILMEYIQGQNIDEYLSKNPSQVNDVFLQVLKGFTHLQTKDILHRDIRPMNIMVRNDGIVKIIDLGFGKQVKEPVNFDKSISLNWWCNPPSDFLIEKYDFCTEIYFVGKLFEQIIQENKINNFKYTNILKRMCQWSYDNRICSFSEVEKEIQNNRFDEITFFGQELNSYRQFADSITSVLTKIENGTKYLDDIDKIKSSLLNAYRNFMLEQEVPDSRTILRCFLSGTYYYRKNGIPVSVIENFIELLKSSEEEKSRIIIANLHSRFDSIARYIEPVKTFDDFDDEIPF